MRVRARGVFTNCPCYIHKYQLEERSQFLPRASCPTPVPDWKRFERARDVPPANESARSETSLLATA